MKRTYTSISGGADDEPEKSSRSSASAAAPYTDRRYMPFPPVLRPIHRLVKEFLLVPRSKDFFRSDVVHSLQRVLSTLRSFKLSDRLDLPGASNSLRVNFSNEDLFLTAK
jgi:hypothetical protein